MTIVVGEPGQRVVGRQRGVGRCRVQTGRTTEQQAADRGRSIDQLGVYANRTSRKNGKRIRRVVAHAVADRAFGEDALEAEQAAVSRLQGAAVAVARAVTRGREQIRCAATEPAEPATTTAHRRRARVVARQRDRERIAAIRIRLHVVETVEHGSAIDDALRGVAAHRDRHITGAENAEQTRDGVSGHARRLEAQRAFAEERLQVLQATIVLERRVEEGAIGLDRSGRRAAQRHVRKLLTGGEPGLVEPLHLRRNQVAAQAAPDEVRARARAHLQLTTGEATARNVVGRRGERGHHAGIARQRRVTEVETIELGIVLVAAQAEHGERVGGTVGAEQQLDAWDGRGHCGQIAQLIGGEESGRGVINRFFGTRDIGHGIAARRRGPLGDLHRVERDGRWRHASVGNQDFLISRALHLIATGAETDRREGHPVVAFPAGEGDRVATVLVGA